MSKTPVILRVNSKTGTTVAVAEIDYHEIEAVSRDVIKFCEETGYSYTIVVPHTAASLKRWLGLELSKIRLGR